MCLFCEDIVGQTDAQMAIFGEILRPVFSASRVQHVSDLHLKFALGHTMCGSMVYIQSAAAEIRRGKKKEEEDRRNHRAKIQWPALFHRAAINITVFRSR